MEPLYERPLFLFCRSPSPTTRDQNEEQNEEPKTRRQETATFAACDRRPARLSIKLSINGGARALLLHRATTTHNFKKNHPRLLRSKKTMR